MVAFHPPALPLRRRARRSPFPATCQLSPSASSSALDDVAPSVKLNAVAAALARRRDYTGALRVVREMSTAGVSLDPPALTAIVDSAVPAPAALASLLRAAAPAGYAARTIPSTIPAEQRPIDPARAADLSLAVSFLVVVSGAVSAEVLEPPLVHHPANEATSILLLLFAGLLFDRYAAAAVTWRRISSGLARIFADDPVRSARVDAAHFLIAYLFGLPWMCFRPDPKQIIKFHSRRGGEQDQGGATLGVNGIMDEEIDMYLVWLVAGVAIEDQMDGMLIESDLRGARALLRTVSRARRKNASGRNIVAGVRDEERIRLAIAHAKDMLQQNGKVHSGVTERMLKGGSVGDCVAVVVNSFT